VREVFVKRYAPLLLLFLFILAEAFFKDYLQYTSELSSCYPYLFYAAGTILICSLFYFYFFFRNRPEFSDMWESLQTPSPTFSWSMLIVVTLILVGCFFRLWKLGSLFEGMTYDESYKGLDAIAIRQFGERPVFLSWNGGREALVAYLVAISQSLFDHTSISVRIISVTTGCFSLLFFYLLAKRLFNQNVAIVSLFLMAVSKWHIIHSRYGVRAGQFTMYELATLYFVARGLQSEKKAYGAFLAAGFFAAAGFYTYIAYRIFPLVLLIFVLQKDFRAGLRRQIGPIVAALVLSAALIAPMAVYYVQNSAAFTRSEEHTS